MSQSLKFVKIYDVICHKNMETLQTEDHRK